MKLDMIDIDPNDLIPTVKFMGETNYDGEQLKKIDDINSLVSWGIIELKDVVYQTRNRGEASIVDIHDAAQKALKDIQETLGE